MNEMIELHDSKLVALSWADGVAILLLRPAYVHRSEGRPGVDPGTSWLQQAMITVTNASVSIKGELPMTIYGGYLTVGAEKRENLIPAAGVFVGNIKLEFELQEFSHLTVTCDQLMITLTGEADFLEKFEPQTDGSASGTAEAHDGTK